MFKKLTLILFFLLILLVSLPSFVFAQDEIPDDVIVGGKAKCFISGRSPFKKFIADGNRLLILQAGDISKGSFSLQSIYETKNENVDINVLALLGEISNVDEFLNGKSLTFQNSGSDLIVKIIEKVGSVTDVFNKDPDGIRTELVGKIKITKSQNNLVNGRLRLFFKKVFFTDSEDGDEIQSLGKIISDCKFKDVPLAIKELE